MLKPPYPELDALLITVGQVGKRLSEIEASEGAADDVHGSGDGTE